MYQHQIRDQTVCFLHCPARIFNEASLILLSVLLETLTLRCRKRTDRQLLDTLGASPQLGFSLAAVAHGGETERTPGARRHAGTRTAGLEL